ncbi:MAG: D-amino acid dehydrogenase [Oleiphilaceae bacterium]|nr:D-amino acid dehydrogenase [Oleiphilaceae bacterium]
MRVLIVGAGVVGVTTAWVLFRRGHDVTVVEALESAALETSYGNAGQRSYGHVTPWADPGLVSVGLRGLLRPQGPLKIPAPPSMKTLGFLLSTARYAFTPGVYQRNNQALLRLAQFSREAFLSLERRLSLAFDGQHEGLVELASDAPGLTALKHKARDLAELGVPHHWLEREALRAREPGMHPASVDTRGLLIEGDGTGDCHRFTQSLAQTCQRQGVRFHYQSRVTDWELDGDRISGVHGKDARGEHWQDSFDQVVLCAGNGSASLARPLGLKIPVYPVKGYSLTADIRNESMAPRSTVVDLGLKVAMTRLGKRMRVTGFVELADFDRSQPPQRLAVLRKAVESRFPGAADFSQASPWCGFRPMLPDGPPALGWGPRENLLVNTGHGTFGWTLSAGSAEVIGHLLDGEPCPLDLACFSPNRFRLSLIRTAPVRDRSSVAVAVRTRRRRC